MKPTSQLNVPSLLTVNSRSSCSRRRSFFHTLSSLFFSLSQRKTDRAILFSSSSSFKTLNMGQVSYLPGLPNWLSGLLGEKFFHPCLVHESVKKNENNIWCLDCFTSFCTHCISPHRSHRLLQIRRYVYHDVIRLDDMEKLIDCEFVQTYTTNGAKVMFIKQRPQSRPFRTSGNTCSTCDRSLQDPYLYCSLACKVSYLVRTEGGVSRHLYECDFLPLSEGEKGETYDFEDGQLTPDSVLESPLSSGSSASGGGGGAAAVAASFGGFGIGSRILACTATTEIVRKKRSSVTVVRNTFRPTCCNTSEIGINASKRKGVPQRSPLH